MSERDLDWAEPQARNGFVSVPNWLVDRDDLTAHAKTAYMVVARHINRKSGDAWPGMERIAELIGCAEDRAREALRELQGWRKGESSKDPAEWSGPPILTSRRRGLGRTNLYRLCSEEPASGSRHTPDAEPDISGIKNPATGGTNQTEENQTELNHVVERAGVRSMTPVYEALQNAGFDRLLIEQRQSGIGLVVSQCNPPPDTDWHQVGVRIEHGRSNGTIKTPHPDGALKFVLKSLEGVPRVGQAPGPHLFPGRPLTAAQQREAFNDQLVRDMLDDEGIPPEAMGL